MAVTFLINNGNFLECLSQRHRGHRVLVNYFPLLCVLCASVRNLERLTFSPKDYTVLICTQMSPSQNSEKFCAEAMFCQILKKLFSYIFLFVSITCKSGVYACVSSMPVKCAGNMYNRKKLGNDTQAVYEFRMRNLFKKRLVY